MAELMRGFRGPGCVGALLLLAGCGGGAVPATAQAESLNRVSVSQYMRLQASAEDEAESALLLGAYVAGLFTGLEHLNRANEPRLVFCPPRGLRPELRDLLNFIDEALPAYREGLRDADAALIQDVLLDALIERFPCDPDDGRDT
ncbi:MAG: hypothetical protein JJU27_10195 [Gammaproteobacteria bacterium]|nr:hypothetical protein [Gammaproteobacteria bacterium]